MSDIPAFPEIQTSPSHDGHGDVYSDVYSSGGMSLRDYFAAKALLTLCMTPAAFTAACETAKEAGMTNLEGIAKMSYELADAMLKAREK